MKISATRIVLIACLFLATIAGAFAEDTLKIGAPAPALKVSKWVKGGPVDGFNLGQVYVVEFWATWCVPCKVSIPHLTELAKKFKDQVSIIGVSVWEQDQDNVEPFVENMGDAMDYNVAMDDQASATARAGFMSKNWLDAAERNMIPTAFVVGKDGKIAWIGGPLKLDDVLTQVVAGTWDARAFAKQFEAEKEAKKRQEAIANHPVVLESQKIRALVAKKEYAEALKEAAVLEKMPQNGAPIVPQDFAVISRLVVYGRTGDMEAFYKTADAGSKRFKNDPFGLNEIAWMIVDPQSPLAKKDFDFALKLALRAVDLNKRKHPDLLDTLAWAHYNKGDKADAIACEKEALALLPAEQQAPFNAALQKFEGG